MDFLASSSPLSLYLLSFALFLLFFVFIFVFFLPPTFLVYSFSSFSSILHMSLQSPFSLCCSMHLPESLSLELMWWLYRLQKRKFSSLLPALACVSQSALGLFSRRGCWFHWLFQKEYIYMCIHIYIKKIFYFIYLILFFSVKKWFDCLRSAHAVLAILVQAVAF